MTVRPRHLLALIGAAILLAGCGSGDDERGPGVPSDLARQIAAQLDLVQDRIDVTRDTDKIGSCNDIELKSAPDIDRLIALLPEDTDPEIVDTLEQGVARLRELASQECSDLEGRIDQNTDTTPAETVPEETAPEETDTQPPETIPETVPEEEATPGGGKEKKDKDNGGGAVPPGQGGGGAPAPLPGESD